MNIFKIQRGSYVMSAFDKIAVLLVLSVLFWATGVPMLLSRANAASLTSVSDTLSTSKLSTLATHTIQFTNSTSMSAGETLRITLDPLTSAFTEVFSAATTTDITATGMTIASTCSGGPTDEVTVSANYNTGSNEYIEFTVCSGDTISSGTKTIVVGAVTRLWTNPSSDGSYRITIGGTMANSGETRIYALNNVTLTAAVSTSFTFTVAGLATSTSVNGDTTTGGATGVLLPFGTLASGTPVVLGQQLSVSTNARNGFSVTVQENQNPLSSTGADIDLFKNGATTTPPEVWVAPTAVLDQEWTYGHIGLTTDDADVDGGSFVGTKYAGNFAAPLVVFSHNGPSDGTTQNKGKADVAYKVQISDLQEAGNDYTNTLTYVATPTF